jgi:hypothetical protein
LTKRGLSRGLRSNDARDLGEHSCTGILIDFQRVTCCINLTNLSELLVVVYYGHVLGRESLETLLNGFQVIVRTTLTTAHDALGANVLRAVEEKHCLGLTHMGLEVRALINFSGITINQVVLWKIKHSGASIDLKFDQSQAYNLKNL